MAHTGLDDLRIVGSMHERKALMADLSDGFVALPGGFGTLEEFCEVLTWSQLGLHPVPKPCGLLDVAGYFAPLVALFDRGVDEGFIRPEHRGLVLADDDVDAPARRARRLGAPAAHPQVGRMTPGATAGRPRVRVRRVGGRPVGPGTLALVAVGAVAIGVGAG